MGSYNPPKAPVLPPPPPDIADAAVRAAGQAQINQLLQGRGRQSTFLGGPIGNLGGSGGPVTAAPGATKTTFLGG